jgi:AraC-like DNA-binding protein
MNIPLSAHQIVTTTDPDEAQSILSREMSELRFSEVKNQKDFRFQMNGIHLGQTMIGYNKFDTHTSIDAGEVDEAFILIFGSGASSAVYLDGDPIDCTQSPVVSSRTRNVSIERYENSELYIFRADYTAILQRLEALLDRKPTKELIFDPKMDLDTDLGKSISSLLYSVIEGIKRGKGSLTNPLIRGGLDELVLGAILSLPNAYSEELLTSGRLTTAPRVVRQAEEFLEANACDPVTISDLVTHCGCSRRTLFSTFRKFRGYTPHEFLTSTRLRMVRELLRASSKAETVTSAAHQCGFTHHGRFSSLYHQEFGEMPSKTLRDNR